MKIIGLAGWSGAGKTTLVTRLIPALALRGVSVSTLKHAHHEFDIDQKGKDSFAHREAGAREVLIASSRRFALMRELRGAPEPGLAELLARLSPVDLVIVEGFKRENHRKIEVHRAANGKPWLYPADGAVRALVCDAPARPADLAEKLAFAHLDDIPAVVDIVLRLAQPLDEALARLARAP